MRRKIILLFLLFIPFIVKAEDISIKSIELIENNTQQEKIDAPTVDGLNINFKIKFANLDESVKYKVILNNNSDHNYELTNKIVFSNKEYIKYELEYPFNARVLKAKSSQELFITIKYNKEVPSEAFSKGIYIENNSLNLDLENSASILDQIGLPVIIMVTVAALSLIFIIIMSIKKHSLAMLLIALLLIPMSVYALGKVTININANIEIESRESIFELRTFGCSKSRNGNYFIRFRKGMTMPEFYNSKYFEAMDPNLQEDMKTYAYPALFNRDAQVCLNEGSYNPGDMTRYYDCTSGRWQQIEYENTPITNQDNGVYIIIADC